MTVSTFYSQRNLQLFKGKGIGWTTSTDTYPRHLFTLNMDHFNKQPCSTHPYFRIYSYTLSNICITTSFCIPMRWEWRSFSRVCVIHSNPEEMSFTTHLCMHMRRNNGLSKEAEFIEYNNHLFYIQKRTSVFIRATMWMKNRERSCRGEMHHCITREKLR